MARQKKILLIDDCGSDVELFREILSQQGFSVEAAPEIDDFLSLLREKQFDLLLIDQMMFGQLDAGTELIESLFDEFDKELPPTYLMSGLPVNFVEDRVAQSGAAGFLSKDEPAEMVAAVQKILNA
ncbi:MAG: response regulator [Myxococcota bacterium]